MTSGAAPSALHIVVVDDDPQERRQLAELVVAEGYRATKAGGGREALDLFAEDQVDLVVTELFMADIDGWELLDRVKKLYPQTHVVVTTGNITEQGEAVLRSRKADGYLIKPVQQRPLHILFRALLEPGNLDRPTEIMAVDSDRETLQDIERILGDRGMSVISYNDVRKAEARMWDDPPDLVITEVQVGRGSGFDLCEAIRSTRELPPVPILLLSGRTSKENMRRAVQLRVNGFLVKPLDAELLTTRVFKLLRQAWHRAQIARSR